MRLLVSNVLLLLGSSIITHVLASRNNPEEPMALRSRNLKGVKKADKVKNKKGGKKDGKMKNKGKTKKDDKVVIVGGGAAGTYLAWRLATAPDSIYTPDQIYLYERTDHISGRVFSPTIGENLCNVPSTTAVDESHLPRTELGGMRIRVGKDRLTQAVMDELSIETGPFYMNHEDETSSEPMSNPLYARNTLGTRADFLVGGNKIPFTLGPQYFPPGNMSDPYSPLPDHVPVKETISLDGFDPCDGATNKEVFYQPYGPEGQPFYTYSLDEADHEFLGQTLDHRTFIDAISGYSIQNHDVGSGSPDFAGVLPSDEFAYNGYVRPLKGMESIPHAMLDAAVKLGVKSHLNHEVTKLSLHSNGKWTVTVRETTTSSCTGITKVKNGGLDMFDVRASKVILALPGAALRRITFETPDKSGAVQRKIRGLVADSTPLQLMKLFAAYDTRWFNKVNHLDTFSPTEDPVLAVDPTRSTNFTAGRFTNDINSHIFAWYPGTQSRPGIVEANARACGEMGVIQQYTMPNNLNRYGPASEYEAQYACEDEATCDVCNPDSSNAWFSPGISQRLHSLVKNDMSTMFRTMAPDAAEIKYRIWSGDNPTTMSDGVHFWKAGVKWWERYQEALQPSEDGNLHLIGEVFSHNQGWIEGALETAEHLVQEVMNMDGPTWLSNEDYCKSMPFYENRPSQMM